MLQWKWMCKYLFGISCFGHKDRTKNTYPEVELMKYIVILLLFVVKSYTVFHSVCTILHSHQQVYKDSNFSLFWSNSYYFLFFW